MRGATWYVDGSVSSSGDGKSLASAFKKIQEGIDAASNGDTVIVAEGTYLENINFNGKSIVLTSTDPLEPDVVKNTIIDGNQAGSVVTLAGTENETCVLSGLTIRNGKADGGGGVSGGSRENRSRATIQNNTITGNSADSFGGGLFLCNGTIQNNAITGNSAQDGPGGGLMECGGTIRGNTINGTCAGAGGGLYFCHGLVSRNVIKGNSAVTGGGLKECGGMIDRNVVMGNSVGQYGGGLRDCGGTIQNNLIAGNTAGYTGGGLIYCGGTIRDNMIVGNAANWNNGGGLDGCGGTILNCILWGNTAPGQGIQVINSSVPTYSCIQFWTGGGEENTTRDPRFVDREGPDDDPATFEDNDYHLDDHSPCIDTGKNEDWMTGAFELDGNPRIAFGVNSATVDMGAYEYSAFVFEIVAIAPALGGTEVTWASAPGASYGVWSCVNLVSGPWSEEAIVPSAGDSTAWTDPDTASPRKFYRVELK